MAVDFFIEPSTFDIPKKFQLREQWKNIPNTNIIDVVAGEEQYLIFQRFLLDHILFTKEGGYPESITYRKNLDLSVRAGAVKATVLLASSITEAVLRAHAEKRNYRLHVNPYSRTFGNVIKAWLLSKNPEIPHSDISDIWSELKGMQETRNNVHLFKAANDSEAVFQRVLELENNTLNNIDKVLLHLKNLISE